MKLWLLRHARVHLDSGVCYGITDVPADNKATDAAADLFANYPAPGSALWSSPLKRTLQLTEALRCRRADLQVPFLDVRLQEMDFGCWEMKQWDEIPKKAVDDWVAEFATHRFGGLENAQDVINRVADALEQARALDSAELIWVTHAGVIRAVQYLMAHGMRKKITSVDDWPSNSLKTGEWIVVEI